jgi:hypothetical protein
LRGYKKLLPSKKGGPQRGGAKCSRYVSCVAVALHRVFDRHTLRIDLAGAAWHPCPITLTPHPPHRLPDDERSHSLSAKPIANRISACSTDRQSPFIAALNPWVAVVALATSRSLVAFPMTRVIIWGPETYAYHAKWLVESPEKYQAATRVQMIRSNEIKPDVYAYARRQLDLVRREIKKVFTTVDLLITPTMKGPPATIAATINPPMPAPNAPRNGVLGNINSPGAFDVYGIPAITIPCGFTNSGLPIGLQISAAPFAEPAMLAMAHAYEQATEWHTRRPNLGAL